MEEAEGAIGFEEDEGKDSDDKEDECERNLEL